MQDISLNDLLEAGCHFGHQKRRWNPAMTRFIYGERDGVHIFDLAKTKLGLEQACEFAKNTAASGGKILFVATKRQAADFVKNEAIRVGMPYITVRWMGGFLTNYGHLSKSMKKLADDKTKREAGDFKKYTKKERLLIDREIAKLEKFFSAVMDLPGMPAALFVVDTHREDVAVREGFRMGVPVIGIVDTNSDPTMVEHVIPANDDAVKSIELIVKTVADAIEEGKKQGEAVEAKATEKVKSKSKAKKAEVKDEN